MSICVAGPTPELILDALARILGSRAFHSAARQRSFLQHIVEESLARRAEQLKEYSIGVSVFDKDVSFDPRFHSIVRTEARKLRARLAKYYQTEGSAEAVRIELPVGTYAPRFGFGMASAAPALASRTQPVRARAALPRVVVLPFETRGDWKHGNAFGDGLTDEVSHSLARLGQWEVVARTSAFQFQGRPMDVCQLGERLNVQAVVEGSVRKSGSQVRILAQIDDARSGHIVWSRTYDRSATATFRAQSEIAKDIAAALTPAADPPLVPQKPDAVLSIDKSVPRSDPRAYEEYLQGIYCWNQHTAHGVDQAARFFERAVQRDVRFARAYTNLAYAYLMAPVLKAALPSAYLPKVRAAATKALEIDPLSGEAHIALALPMVQDFQWNEAGRQFRRGLELAPLDAFGHSWHGMYLATVGRPADALQEQARAVQLDPSSAVMVCCQGLTFYLLRRYAEAERCFRRALALDPSLARAHAGLGMAYSQGSDHAGAIAELEQAAALTPGMGRVRADLGYAYAAAGKTDKARQVLNEFLSMYRPKSFPAFMIAQMYIGLGEPDPAFQWLNRVIDQKDLPPFLTCDPLFDSLRGDERFSALLRRTNLA